MWVCNRLFRVSSLTGLGLVVGATIGLFTETAHAQYASEAQPGGSLAGSGSQSKASAYVFSVRPSVGVGGGWGGVGARVGIAAEFWPTRFVGVGLLGASLGQDPLGSDYSTANLIAPVVTFRSGPKGGYFLGSLGAGYARARLIEGPDTVCLQQCVEGERSISRFNAYTVQAALGWLGHPSGSMFEIGPVARLDVIADARGDAPTNALITLNLEVGLAVPES